MSLNSPTLADKAFREAVERNPVLTFKHEDSVNYIFITDIHYNSETEYLGDAIVSQIKAAVDFANNNECIDFIAIGGDITTGMFAAKEDAFKETNKALAPLKECKKPVLVLMGNHDDNCYHIYSEKKYDTNRIISKKDWNENVSGHIIPKDIVRNDKDPDGRYYYYDLKSKKTRIVCLDALDYDYEPDDKGGIKNLIYLGKKTYPADEYISGATWWGYSEKQMKWLIESAMNAPKGYNYVFISHMGVDFETNCYSFKTKFGDELRKIITAYQNKGVFEDEAIGTKDFSGALGKILVYHFGHIHMELFLHSPDMNLTQISTGSTNWWQMGKGGKENPHINDKTLDWRTYERARGNTNEAMMDIVLASENGIKKIAVGAGEDYEG